MRLSKSSREGDERKLELNILLKKKKKTKALFVRLMVECVLLLPTAEPSVIFFKARQLM